MSCEDVCKLLEAIRSMNNRVNRNQPVDIEVELLIGMKLSSLNLVLITPNGLDNHNMQILEHT